MPQQQAKRKCSLFRQNYINVNSFTFLALFTRKARYFCNKSCAIWCGQRTLRHDMMNILNETGYIK